MQSCKDELWKPISQYLIEEVPQVLKSANITSKQDVLSIVLGLLPGEVTSFVKWIAEVQRADSTPNGASEADLPLNAKIKILEELRKTELYLIVSQWAKGAVSTCPRPVLSLAGDELSEVLKKACCHGAAAFSGVLNSSSLCCKNTSMTKRFVGDSETLIVMGDISSAGGTQEKVDIVIPTSLMCNEEGKCIHLHPASADMLTMLLFALPADIWRNIVNTKVQSELVDFVSVANLPMNFQSEVENLREQLYLVHCYANIDENLEHSSPL